MVKFLNQKRNLIIVLILGILVWHAPIPEGLDPKAWQLFAIFLTTILAIISNALPMGAGTLMGLTAAVMTQSLTFKEAFEGYTSSVVWLVLIAFFISHGFIISGLGKRIAYLTVKRFGKTLIGLGYAISFTKLILAPAVPSVTARSGGIVYPIVIALTDAFGSHKKDNRSRKVGAYMISVAYQATVITSAMFLTAMAANPMVQKLAGFKGIEITWGTWALAASVPGILSLLVVPLVCNFFFKPEMTIQGTASEVAHSKLQELGPMTYNEWVMLVTFLGLLGFWSLGPMIGVSTVLTALVGIFVLVIFDVVKWRDLMHQGIAWETFVWFGALIGLTGGLNEYGMTQWFGDWVGGFLATSPWMVATLVLFLVYFYSHYFFASSTAHVSALYLPFLTVALTLGAPPLPTALLFAFSGEELNQMLALAQSGIADLIELQRNVLNNR